MNETVLIVTALIDLGMVLGAYMIGREWLYATIVINLLLISLFGAKLVPIFGHATNSGNVFYACVFFAMYLLMEHGSVRHGLRAIWIGAGGVAMFFSLAQLALVLTSVAATQDVSALMSQILTMAPRIACASLVAYIAAQYMNVWLYTLWHESIGSAHWWVKIACIIAAAQLVDSTLFFSIGFIGTIDMSAVFESMVVGYVIKLVIGIASIPLLYLSHYLKGERIVS